MFKSKKDRDQNSEKKTINPKFQSDEFFVYSFPDANSLLISMCTFVINWIFVYFKLSINLLIASAWPAWNSNNLTIHSTSGDLWQMFLLNFDGNAFKLYLFTHRLWFCTTKTAPKMVWTKKQVIFQCDRFWFRTINASKHSLTLSKLAITLHM